MLVMPEKAVLLAAHRKSITRLRACAGIAHAIEAKHLSIIQSDRTREDENHGHNRPKEETLHLTLPHLQEQYHGVHGWLSLSGEIEMLRYPRPISPLQAGSSLRRMHDYRMVFCVVFAGFASGIVASYGSNGRARRRAVHWTRIGSIA